MRSIFGLDMGSKILFLLFILLAVVLPLGLADSVSGSSFDSVISVMAAAATGPGWNLSFLVTETTPSLSIPTNGEFLPFIPAPSSMPKLSVTIVTPGMANMYIAPPRITTASTMEPSALNSRPVMTVPDSEKFSFIAPPSSFWSSLGLNVSFVPVNESTPLNITAAAAEAGDAVPLNSTASLLYSTPSQAMYFRNVSRHDAWLYLSSKGKRATEDCQCFDPASNCCTTGYSDVGPFCIPANGTCCANTYCMPGEQCCGDGCCPAGTDCQTFPGGCCNSNSTCNAPATCLSYTDSLCKGVSDSAIRAMECCPSSLPFCAILPGSGAGCYAVLPTNTSSVSFGSKHGTTTVTVTPSPPTGVYVATETPATTWACTIYTTVQSSTASGPSSTSARCFDQTLLSAVSCPATTTIFPLTTVFSRPTTTSGDFHAPGITTLHAGQAPGRTVGGLFWAVAVVVGVFVGR